MSIVKLQNLEDATVVEARFAMNQAATLRVQHEVPVDSVFALKLGTKVEYEDPDIGLIFRGKIVEIDEAWEDGEGIEYLCANAYRTLAKEPANLNASSKIKVKAGTDAESALTNILANIDTEILGGGFEWTSPDLDSIPEIEGGGQSVSYWIDQILRYSPDTFAEVVPDGTANEKLFLRKISAQPNFTLEEGTFSNPEILRSDDPLFVSGSVARDLDDKYGKIRVEGCGEFTQRIEQFISGEVTSQDPTGLALDVKFRPPAIHQPVTNRRIDAEGNCREGAFATIQIGWAGPNPLTFDLENMQLGEDAEGQFFLLTIHRSGVFSTLPPPVPLIAGWFNYTSYDGPLAIEKVATDPELAAEGTFVEQHEELFKFNAAIGFGVNVDNSTIAQEIADNLFERYSDRSNRNSDFVTHIHGLSPIKLGSKIVNADFDEGRVQTIVYDFVSRNTRVVTSDLLDRREIRKAKDAQRLEKEDGGNWIGQKEPEKSCFCGGPLYTDETETPQSPTHGGGSGGVGTVTPVETSYDCNQGFCDQRNDSRGQYATLDACLRDCGPGDEAGGGWDFIPCFGCTPGGELGFGAYQSETDCVNDNPDPFDPIFGCDSEGGVSNPPGSGSPGFSGSDKIFECSGCCTAGAGGKTFFGFVKKIVLDRHGRVKKVECQNCEGFTGDVSAVCDISTACCGTTCTDLVVTVKKQILTYSCGIVVNVGPCQ